MLLVPTRRRLEKLRNFCNSAVRTKTTCPALIIVDNKDYIDNQKEYSLLEQYHFPNDKWKLHVTEAEGMGQKVRETEGMWKNAPWVGILNDDHVIKTEEWDKKLVAKLNGKNFVTSNDRWNAPQRAAGATVFSMDLVRAFEFPLFPPQIDHLGIDDAWEIIGRNTGCWEIDMSVIVEHHHVFKNPDYVDETHTQIYGPLGAWDGSPQHKDVTERMQRFLQETAPHVVERVKKLQMAEPKVVEFLREPVPLPG